MHLKISILSLALLACPAFAAKTIEYSTLVAEKVSHKDTQPNIEISCSPSNKLTYYVSKFLPISSKYSQYTIEYRQDTTIACEGPTMPVRRYFGNQPTSDSTETQLTIPNTSPDLSIINNVFQELAKIDATPSTSILFTNKVRTTMIQGSILRNEYATDAGITCQKNNLYTITDYSTQKTMETKWQCPYSERDHIGITQYVKPINNEGTNIKRFAFRFNSFEHYARAWRNISNSPL